MIGLIFLSAFTLLIASYLAFLAYASRQGDDKVLWALFPPYGCYFLVKNKQTYRRFNWFFFPLLLLCVVLSIINFVVLKEVDSSTDMQSMTFDSVKLDASTVRLIQGQELLPDTELKISHPTLNAQMFMEAMDSQGSLNLKDAMIEKVVKDSATKQLIASKQTLSVAFSNESQDLSVTLLSTTNPSVTIEVFNWRGNMATTAVVIDKSDIERAIAAMWSTAPEGFSYSLGGMKRLSEKQTSAVISFFHQGKRVSQNTVTVDLKAQGVQLNYRSMLLIRQVLNDFRNQSRSERSQASQVKSLAGAEHIDTFYSQWQRFKGQTIELIKKPGIKVVGTLASVDKGKRISILQNRGAGSVMAKIPNDLVERLFIDGVEYKYIAPNVIYVDELTGEEIPPEKLSSTLPATPNQPPLPDRSVLVETTNKSVAVGSAPVNSGNQDSQPIGETVAVKEDPYMALVGKKLEVTTVSGAKRTGELIKVVAHKTIVIGSKHGGLKISIPQKDIQEYQVLK